MLRNFLRTCRGRVRAIHACDAQKAKSYQFKLRVSQLLKWGLPHSVHRTQISNQSPRPYEQREKVRQMLRVWLSYRSAKDFGKHRTPPQKCVNA